MRVLILSQYYAPEPVPKPSDLAAALKNRGHSVRVLTGYPNYPSGRVYEGYQQRLFERTTHDGITVLRTYEYPYHGRRVLGRMANYLSLVISMTLAVPRLDSADVMYVWHPPLTIGIAAWVVSRLRRMPFVYDVQDIWPESAVLSGLLRPGRLVRLISRIEKFVYARADHILVVTEGARSNLMAKGVDERKISVMPHWVDEDLFVSASARERDEVRKQYGWGNKFVVLFAGNLGLVQGLDTVIEAATSLDSTGTKFVLLGDGADRDRLRELAVADGVTDRVQFIDRQPLSAMPGFMAAADALLVHLRPSELSRYVIPTKTFAYLAAGKPIIMAMDGAAADLVKHAEAGMIVPPGDARSLAESVFRLAAMTEEERQRYGLKGQAFLHANFSKDRVINMYEELLSRIAETSR